MEGAKKTTVTNAVANEGIKCSEDINNRIEEAHAVKRQRDDTGPDDDPSDAEPEEKRRAGTFRLNPPTLIHGKAKSAPKEEDASSKRKFLRPSTLSAPSTVTRPVTSAPSSTSVPLVSSISQAPVLGASLSISSKNPFLKTEEGDDKATEIEKPQQNSADKGDSASDTTSDKKDGEKENVFLKMQSTTSPTKDSNEESSGFVFGSKMEERVVKTEADSTCSGESSEFLFGKNLSDRVKVANPDSSKTSSLQIAPTESVLFHDSSKSEVTSSTSSNKLEESAAALFNVSNTKVVIPEVEVKTGEEDEKNVLQIQCKLHQYDSSNSKNWVERGRGMLRLNDGTLSSADCKFQSRLVMRMNGSLRLILNTKIWATMTVDRASPKSVRISAQNENGDIGVYLITATINDAEQLYRAIEYRLLHLKQLENDAQKKAEELEGEVACANTSVTSPSNVEDANKDQRSESPVQPDTTTSDSVDLPQQSDSSDKDGSSQQSSLKCSAEEKGDSSPTAKTAVLSTKNDNVQNGKNVDLALDEKKAAVSQVASHNGETKDTDN